ncbi:Cycloartenol synthase [Nymphaea thermarum]|nr:Cycloartenol synthase [Nymphaea thermarum]
MWRLKVAEGGGNPWLRTVNNHVGRQVWEFDPEFGSEEDRMAVEEARANFTKHKSAKKHSSDLLMRMQVRICLFLWRIIVAGPVWIHGGLSSTSFLELWRVLVMTMLVCDSRAFHLGKENPCDISIPRVSVGETEDVSLEAVTTTLQRALKFYSTIQAHDGHWPGDYGGPMFLMPGLVIVLYVTGALHNNEDGGWGLHIEGHSTMFCTALSYVTLRLLGERLEEMESCRLDKAQKWILDHGSVTAIPSWGKMWLSVLGVYDWSGNNPLPPEIWLLPYFIPLHPGNYQMF